MPLTGPLATPANGVLSESAYPRLPQQYWQIILDGMRTGTQHMQVDEQLAREAMLAVRFFRWDPAISTGWKQPQPAWMQTRAGLGRGVEIVERPTGGGLAFHGSDVSLAVTVSRSPAVPLQTLMAAVCRSAARLCHSYGAAASMVRHVPATSPVTCCLTERSSYAVMIGGQKVAGFALRRYPESWLIQGSILVLPLLQAVRGMLPQALVSELATRAAPLASGCREPITVENVMARWAAHWASWWELAHAL